jgi:hypothetical protein
VARRSLSNFRSWGPCKDSATHQRHTSLKSRLCFYLLGFAAECRSFLRLQLSSGLNLFEPLYCSCQLSCVSAKADGRTNERVHDPVCEGAQQLCKINPQHGHARSGAREIDRRRAQSTFCRHLMHGGALQLSKTKISVPLAVQRTPHANWQKATRFLHVLSAFVITDGHLVRWSCSFSRKKHALCTRCDPSKMFF